MIPDWWGGEKAAKRDAQRAIKENNTNDNNAVDNLAAVVQLAPGSGLGPKSFGGSNARHEDEDPTFFAF